MTEDELNWMRRVGDSIYNNPFLTAHGHVTARHAATRPTLPQVEMPRPLAVCIVSCFTRRRYAALVANSRVYGRDVSGKPLRIAMQGIYDLASRTIMRRIARWRRQMLR